MRWRCRDVLVQLQRQGLAPGAEAFDGTQGLLALGSPGVLAGPASALEEEPQQAERPRSRSVSPGRCLGHRVGVLHPRKCSSPEAPCEAKGCEAQRLRGRGAGTSAVRALDEVYAGGEHGRGGPEVAHCRLESCVCCSRHREIMRSSPYATALPWYAREALPPGRPIFFPPCRPTSCLPGGRTLSGRRGR